MVCRCSQTYNKKRKWCTNVRRRTIIRRRWSVDVRRSTIFRRKWCTNVRRYTTFREKWIVDVRRRTIICWRWSVKVHWCTLFHRRWSTCVRRHTTFSSKWSAYVRRRSISFWSTIPCGRYLLLRWYWLCAKIQHSVDVAQKLIDNSFFNFFGGEFEKKSGCRFGSGAFHHGRSMTGWRTLRLRNGAMGIFISIGILLVVHSELGIAPSSFYLQAFVLTSCRELINRAGWSDWTSLLYLGFHDGD